MTYLYKAYYNPFIYEVHVPHLIATKYRREWINDFRTDTRDYDNSGLIQFFTYEEYMEHLLRPALRLELNKHIFSGGLIGQLMYGQEYYVVDEDMAKVALMEDAINSPFSMQTIQLVTLGILPKASRRMRLFSDLISNIEDLLYQ